MVQSSRQGAAGIMRLALAVAVIWTAVVAAVSADNSLESNPDLVACREGDEAACIRAAAEALSEMVGLRQVASMETSSGRESTGLLSRTQDFLRSHELDVDLLGSHLSVSARRLDQGYLDFSLNIDQDDEVTDNDAEGEEDQEEGRSKIKKKIKKKLKKSKLKKLIVPIGILVLLKAITVVPLLLGALGLKAWNALQLGFGSFVVSLGLAIWHLCQKLSGEAPPTVTVAAAQPVVSAPASGWDARSLAYRAYEPQQ